MSADENATVRSPQVSGADQYLRSVDLDAVARLPVTERFTHRLVDRGNGGRACMITFVRTPPGSGSPEGTHVHDVDQHLYVLSGTVTFEVNGERFEAGPGSLVFYPAGTAHRNWNAAAEPAVMLAINAPLPEQDSPLSRRIAAP